MLGERLGTQGIGSQAVQEILDSLSQEIGKQEIRPLRRLMLDADYDRRDEQRRYELVVPRFWPSFSKFFMYRNIANIQAASNRKASGDNQAAGTRGVVSDANYSSARFVECDLSNIVFRTCNLSGANFSFSNLKNVRFECCKLEKALFFMNENFSSTVISEEIGSPIIIQADDKDDAEDMYAKELDGLIREEEVTVCSPSRIVVKEIHQVPVNVPPFIADRNPVSNADFREFLKSSDDFRSRVHRKAIENGYYLSYLSESTQLQGDLPVVYVTLFAAAAYAIAMGKRLPQYAECRAIEESPRLEKMRKRTIEQLGSKSIDQYSDLYQCLKDGVYQQNIISEWTYQIDSKHFWNERTLWYDRGIPFPTSQTPTLSRSDPSRIEYLFHGRSYLQKQFFARTSKLATWINQDQGFRCVRDHETLFKANRRAT